MRRGELDCDDTTPNELLLKFKFAAPQKSRARVRDLEVMMLKGPRTCTLIKVIADDGQSGIAEA
jgi:hypothetical protein